MRGLVIIMLHTVPKRKEQNEAGLLLLQQPSRIKKVARNEANTFRL